MKKALTIIIVLAIAVAGLFVFFNPTAWVFAPRSTHEPLATTTPTSKNSSQSTRLQVVQPVHSRHKQWPKTCLFRGGLHFFLMTTCW
jgi:hypothetical protein